MKNESSATAVVPLEKGYIYKSLAFILPIIAFTILTSLGAAFRIPLPYTPVPITMQTFFVLLGGLMLGAQRGALSQVIYLLWGFSGMPLFAGGVSGLAVISGPTGGYLAGFIIAAWLVGNRTRGNTAPVVIIVWTAIGSAVILACGCLWLSAFLVKDPLKTLQLGVLPFLIGDVIKTVAAAGLYTLYRNRTTIIDRCEIWRR